MATSDEEELSYASSHEMSEELGLSEEDSMSTSEILSMLLRPPMEPGVINDGTRPGWEMTEEYAAQKSRTERKPKRSSPTGGGPDKAKASWERWLEYGAGLVNPRGRSNAEDAGFLGAAYAAYAQTKGGSLDRSDQLLPTPRYVTVEHSRTDSGASMANGGVTTGRAFAPFETEVWVSHEQMRWINKVCDTSEDVVSALTNLTDSSILGGLRVEMQYFRSRIRVSETMDELFKTEWEPFVRELITSLLKFGFAVVRLDKTDFLESEEVVPVIVPMEKYSISLVDSFDKRRVYRVYRLDTLPRMDTSTAEKRKRVPNVLETSSRDPMVAVYVLPGFEPAADGSIRSPLSTVADKIRILENSYENYARTDYRLSKPVYGVGTVSTQQTGPDVLRDQVVPEDELGIYIPEAAAKEAAIDREAIRAAAEVAAERCIAAALSNQNEGKTGRLGPNPFSTENPFTEVFAAGTGHTLMPAPIPAFNPNFREFTHIISGLVCGVLGIPMQLVNTTQEIHAANAETAFKMYDKRIRALQKLVQPILQDIFDIAYRGMRDEAHTIFAAEVIKKWASKEAPERPPSSAVKSGSDLLANKLSEAIESSGRPTQAGPRKEAEQMTVGRSLSIGKKVGAIIPPDKDGKPRSNPTGFHKEAKTISIEALKKLAAENIKITIRFHQTPLTSLVETQWAYDQDLIDYETFASTSLEIIGLDSASKLSEAESYAQKEKKRREMAKLDEKYPAPETATQKKGEGEGGSSKPKAKKASSGGTPSASRPASGGGGSSARTPTSVGKK